MSCVACASMYGQNRVFDNPDNKTYYGLRLGGELVVPGSVSSGSVAVDMFNVGGGVEFGFICNFPVVANFTIEPGLKFYYNTYSVKNEWLESEFDGLSINKFGLRVPVMAGYHFDFTDDLKLAVFSGPELEVGITAEESLRYDGGKESQSLYEDSGDMRRVTVLWGLGAGLHYKRMYFEIKENIGMINMFKDSYTKFHENRVTFSIGYNF